MFQLSSSFFKQCSLYFPGQRKRRVPFLEESESGSDDYSEPAAVSRDAKKGMYTIIIREVLQAYGYRWICHRFLRSCDVICDSLFATCLHDTDNGFLCWFLLPKITIQNRFSEHARALYTTRLQICLDMA